MPIANLPPAAPSALAKRPRKVPKPRPDCCLNCGAAAAGKFCAACGQEIKDHSVSLGPLLSDLLSEVASWDSKMLRTLVPLLVRPGFLSNEYNAGRRVPYLSPLKMYLTLSVLFFLLMGWKNPISQVHVSPDHPAFAVEVHPANITVHNVSHGRDAEPHTLAQYSAQQAALPPEKREPAFQQAITRQAYKAQQSPPAFLAALVGDIPKMMFFLLPLFAVTLKLLYLRTKRLYVEHLIFLLHVHAFAFLALSPLLFARPGWLLFARPGWLAGLVSLALLVYVLTAMRVVYKQGWPKTLVKFSLLSLGYVTLLSVCIAGTAVAALWLL